MKNIGKLTWLLNIVMLFISFPGYSQVLYNIGIEKGIGLRTDRIVLSDSSSIILPSGKPLYSFLLNTRLLNSGEVPGLKNK